MIQLLKILVITYVLIERLKACPSNLTNCKNGMIKFFLFGSQETKAYELLYEEENIKSAPLSSHEKIKILMLNEKYDSEMGQSFRKEYYRRPNVSIIYVDFSELTVELHKIGEKVFSCLKHIARCTSSVLRAILLERVDIQLPQFHVIAFDAAANIPGFMAEHLMRGNLGQLERITKPVMYPDFSFVSQKTNIKSAKFVDVYHANAGRMAAKSFGAHLEVYFNDGQDQPNCTGENPDECSHVRVLQYFVESINSNLGFFGTKCLHHFAKSCEPVLPLVIKLVGEYAYAEDICTAFVKEVFVVKTNELEPFAQGPKRLEAEKMNN